MFVPQPFRTFLAASIWALVLDDMLRRSFQLGALWFLCSTAVLLNRRNIDLQRDRLSVGYRKTQDVSFDRLKLWCVLHSKPLPETIVAEESTVNRLLVDHVQFLYDEKYGVSAGRHAILAMQTRFRALRGRLREAWDSVRSWEQLAPIRLRTPIPDLVLEAMFAFAMITGFTSTGRAMRDWISFGVGLLTCFDGLLRPGEWAILTASKVMMPTSRLQRLVQRGLLTVTNGKNRRVFGRIQIAMVDRPTTLSWLMSGMEGHCRLLPGGTSAFRRLFSLTIKALGLESLRLTPASLRAGGAASRFATGMQLGQLKWWGRWASLTTLEHYAQESAATMVMMTLESDVLDRLEAIVSAGKVFLQPPSAKWQTFFSRASQRLPPRWTSPGSRKWSARRKA